MAKLLRSEALDQIRLDPKRKILFSDSTGYFRGLYAQPEGNESRSDAEIKQEKIDEFNKAEGVHVKRLTDLFQIGHYGDYKRYC